MCGIAGFISFKPKQFDSDRICRVLEKMKSSGSDATGIALVDEKGIATVIKAPICSTDFISKYRGKINKLLESKAKVIMLHTRQGTAGEKNSINAQPIIADKVVLTHNGGVTNIEDLCKAYKIKHKDKLSDSNELAKILSIAKNKGKVLGEAQGTLRLAYFDMEANELMLFNDSYRSCSIKMAYDKEEDLMLYTNEESFIDPYYTEFKYYFGGLFRESVQGYKPNLLTRIMDENEAIKFELKNNKIKRYAMVTEEESKNEAKSSEDFVEWRSKNGEVMGYVKKSVMNDIKEAKEQNKLKADEASDELDFWNSKENQSNFGGGGA